MMMIGKKMKVSGFYYFMLEAPTFKGSLSVPYLTLLYFSGQVELIFKESTDMIGISVHQ